jgi:hypothetical protein
MTGCLGAVRCGRAWLGLLVLAVVFAAPPAADARGDIAVEALQTAHATNPLRIDAARPRPGGGLTHAAAWHDSPDGRVASAWSVKHNRFTLDVTIPPNTTATVWVPGRDAVEVGSGDHRFHSTLEDS